MRGIADVVEFSEAEYESQFTTRLNNYQGLWKVTPVEYKRGKPKKDDRDTVQLCAQVICLEEMMKVKIEFGELYYAQTKHRQRIEIDEKLRIRVYSLAEKMHEMFREGITPPAEVGKHCSICSMVDLCQPRLTKKYRSVANYIRSAFLESEETE
ncbi:CRISPR-associated protein Cas4 [Acetivibrio straminisolvens]|uniref:CRISPR-associated protein Cas4 n=1 Tax=Acetivibrio straminisolvens TaxID=253314 RepID=UPI0026B84700